MRLLVVFLFLLLLPSHAISSEKRFQSVNFYNFDQLVELKKEGDHFLAHIPASTPGQNDATTIISLSLANRVIVGGRYKLDTAALKNSHHDVREVKSIFHGTQAHFYLLTLSNQNVIPEVLYALRNIAGVTIAQPDLLQLHERTHASHEHKHVDHNNSVHKERRRKIYQKYLEVIGVTELWQTTLGKGVSIAVIEDGFDLSHKELDHLHPIKAYNINNENTDISSQDEQDQHGTRITGIIFADHHEGDVKGVAPEANLIALRHTNTWTSQTLRSFALAKEADVINCSWLSSWLLEPVATAVSDLAKHGRQGKGTAIIFSAGNHGKEILPHSTEASIPEAIVVGGHNLRFKRRKNSNYGPSVDLMAFAGRVFTTGIDSSYQPLASTSLAAAIISGISALLISKNPEITLPELQAALVKMTKPPAEPISLRAAVVSSDKTKK